MDSSLFKLAAAAGYGEARLDQVANNLANVNTPGFKSDRLSFSQMLSATGSPIIQGRQFIDMAPGPVEQTGNPLDVAIDGDGFFVIDTPDGERYTRDGGFHVGAGGLLATSDGHPVLGNGGPVAIDPEATDIVVQSGGQVFVDGAQVGSLSVVTFPTQPPVKVGDNLFAGGAAVAVDVPVLAQGMVEGSNVQSMTEMTRMIEITRGYEAYQKLIQTMDEVASQANAIGNV